MREEVRIGFACAGTPTPAVERYGTACVLSVGDRAILVDCGPAATFKLTRLGVKVMDISSLFFTHHHFDHNADYACFALSRWDQRVDHSVPLRVWGPEPTCRLTQTLLGEGGVYAPDWQARVEAPASQEVFVRRGGRLPRPALRVVAEDVVPGTRLSLPGAEVTVHGARHVQPWLSSVSYRFATPAGTVCFTGDSGPCREIVAAAHGVKVLVVNCWDHARHQESDPLACCLVNPREAGTLAAEAGVERLIVTHLTAKQAAPERRDALLSAVREGGYAGDCVVAEEGMWIRV